MNQAQIKRLRTASLLKELIPEALASLDDAYLKGLCVTDVECRRGRYDAFVYLDRMMFDEKEQAYVLSHLKQVSGILEEFCRESANWYRAPKFHFKFDDSLEKQNHMDELFEKIEKEMSKKDENDS